MVEDRMWMAFCTYKQEVDYLGRQEWLQNSQQDMARAWPEHGQQEEQFAESRDYLMEQAHGISNGARASLQETR